MADEREDKTPSTGRKANAAKPPPASNDDVKLEPYPSVRQDDAIETAGEGRSFDPPVAKQQGFEGPQGDPVEDKR
jgi:hypothetical protein